jgi:hypothetical protein
MKKIMNWLIPSYHNNIKYKNVKCRYCGTEIFLNPNIKLRDDELKPINLDNSLHNCYEFD